MGDDAIHKLLGGLSTEIIFKLCNSVHSGLLSVFWHSYDKYFQEEPYFYVKDNAVKLVPNILSLKNFRENVNTFSYNLKKCSAVILINAFFSKNRVWK